MAKLKPCPFCGREDPIVDPRQTVVGVRYRVVCPACMAMVATGTDQNAERAITAWNRRAEERCGMWIKLRKNYSKCSVCKTAYNHPVDWIPDKYCSECGARLFLEE